MRRATHLIATVICLASSGTHAADQILTFTGLGPVRIGMTVPEAESALGAKFKEMNREIEDENCWITKRADNVDPQVTYMIWETKIVRIDVWEGEPEKAEVRVPPIVTPGGIRIGVTERAVRKVYGSRLRITPHYDDHQGHYMDVLAGDRRYGLRFETPEGKVVNFHAGTADAIQLVEGCQ